MPLSPEALEAVLIAVHDGQTASSLETEELDFKMQPDSRPDAIRSLVDSAVCFANANGGTVVMGVADADPGPGAFRGCDLDSATVQRRIHELTEPALMVGARSLEFRGVPLLVIDVFGSFDIHSDTQGRASRRVGTDCVPMTPEDHRRLRESRLAVDWSAQPSTKTLADVDSRAIEVARAALARVPDDRAPLASLSTEDLLRSLGVLTEDGALRRAGEVLFCRPDATDDVAALYQYRQTPAGEATAVERFHLPLILAFERIMETVWARRNVTPVTLPNGQQIEIADFPEIAVREALSNAAIHRDYRLNRPVNIEHSPTSFVVTSPGPLVGSVTTENILTHASTPRNPVLARASRLLRLAEETGRGVDRMFREMIRSGQDLPVIDEGVDFVRVVLAGGAPRTSIARYVAQLPIEEREDTDTMLVLFTLCQRRTVTADEIAPVLQKGPGEAELVLRRLAMDSPGVLEPTRESSRQRKKQYRLRSDTLRALGAAVRYQRRTVDEIDRKVIAHLNEYGRISNRTLQNLFDIDVWRARDILADLQARQVIVRTSEAARGPNVEYGPGPRFPKQRRRRPTPAKSDDPGPSLF